jgi:hypothetical protein
MAVGETGASLWSMARAACLLSMSSIVIALGLPPFLPQSLIDSRPRSRLLKKAPDPAFSRLFFPGAGYYQARAIAYRANFRPIPAPGLPPSSMLKIHNRLLAVFTSHPGLFWDKLD